AAFGANRRAPFAVTTVEDQNLVAIREPEHIDEVVRLGTVDLDPGPGGEDVAQEQALGAEVGACHGSEATRSGCIAPPLKVEDRRLTSASGCGHLTRSRRSDSPVSDTPSNIGEYTVSEISGAIRRTVEDTFGWVRVRGELGRISRPASGHIYLDLKDDRAVLSGVIWKGNAGRLQIQPEQGLEVIATGKITTFPGQSKYQMIIDALEPAGVGALMALLEERKKRLGAE